MRIAVVMGCLVCFVLPGGRVYADAFEGTELLVGRGVKQPVGSRRFSVGLNVQFAPMNAVLGSQKDAFIKSTIKLSCQGNAECEKVASDNIDAAMSAIAEIPDEDWAKIEAAATDDRALNSVLDEMVDKGVLKPQQKTRVQQYSSKFPSSQKRQSVLALTRTLAKTEGTSVLLEPNTELNFDLVTLGLRVPIAMFIFENESKYEMGNLTLDAKFGHSWGTGMAALGVGYGLSLYAPTGTEEAGGMALADLFFGPKFMHGYVTAAPYVAFGFDTLVVAMQGHAEVVSQHLVNGAEGMPGSVMYAKYGGGVVLPPNFPVSVVGEINGLAPIHEADPYDALFAVVGAQLQLIWLKAAVAVQFPLRQPKGENMGQIGGVSIGQLASYSVIARAAFSF